MADNRDSGARRALPGEGTGMSGVVELAEQLAVAVKALEEIERYFVGGWPDPDDLPRIRKLARSGLGKAPWPERGAA